MGIHIQEVQRSFIWEYEQLKTKCAFQTTVFLFLNYLQDYYIRTNNLFKKGFDFFTHVRIAVS